MALILTTYFTLVMMAAMGCLTVQCEPESMARPTRPKVFTSPEELKRYLDLVRDYYSLNGKARYGKRADPSYTGYRTTEQHLNMLRILLSICRQKQHQSFQETRERMDKEHSHKSPIVHPFDYHYE